MPRSQDRSGTGRYKRPSMIQKRAANTFCTHPRPDLSVLGTKLGDFIIAGQIISALAVDRIDHHTLAVLQRRLADEGTKRRLMIDLAESDFPKRRWHRQALGCGNQLFRVIRL